MDATVLDVVKGNFALNHRRLLKSVEDLTDEQLLWRPTPTSHSIGFELWHAARANDGLAVRLSTLTPALRERVGALEQIWTAEGLAAAWNLEPTLLGRNQSGSGMDDEAAAAVRLPGKSVLLDYARRACAASERVVNAIDDTDAVTMVQTGGGWPGDQVVIWYVIFYYGHDDWALGYIAALRRAQGLTRFEA
ncbi:MAG TPA: DinB family protein [bacterium]|jgi:hypothetical protein